MRFVAVVCSLIVALVAPACDEPADPDEPDDPPAADRPDQQRTDVEYRWLPEDDAEKFKAIENQLGGFSVTMEEVGYRYTELYWAGRDRNWGYADYQLEKIESAIEDGIVRRPARAESARDFLDDDVPPLRETIDDRDGEAFDEQIEQFTSACNTCHAKEDVPFVQIAPPEHRLSPVNPDAVGD